MTRKSPPPIFKCKDNEHTTATCPIFKCKDCGELFARMSKLNEHTTATCQAKRDRLVREGKLLRG